MDRFSEESAASLARSYARSRDPFGEEAQTERELNVDELPKCDSCWAHVLTHSQLTRRGEEFLCKGCLQLHRRNLCAENQQQGRFADWGGNELALELLHPQLVGALDKDDDGWRVAYHAKLEGKRRPVWRLRTGGEGGGYAGEAATLEEAVYAMWDAAGNPRITGECPVDLPLPEPETTIPVLKPISIQVAQLSIPEFVNRRPEDAA